MLKYIGSFLLATAFLTQTASAGEINQWQIMPQKHRAAKVGEQAENLQKNAAAAQHRTLRAERVRLVNMKDEIHKLTLSCSVNSGRLQLRSEVRNSVAPAVALSQKALTNSEKKAFNSGKKGEKTVLTLTIDGKEVLQNIPALHYQTKRGDHIMRANLQGDDSTLFLSKFLEAQKTITVKFASGTAESYSAGNAAQAGLALQNCLHK